MNETIAYIDLALWGAFCLWVASTWRRADRRDVLDPRDAPM